MIQCNNESNHYHHHHTIINITNFTLQNATRQARVLLVGSGRMGNIRAKALYSSPKYDFVGVVDSNVDEASKLGDMYRVSILYVIYYARIYLYSFLSLFAILLYISRLHIINH